MNRSRDRANVVQKDRIRSEIDAQVEAYLRAGGKIHVLHGQNGEGQSARGSVWRSADDFPGMGQ